MQSADLAIGAVLVAGGRAPVVVTETLVAQMTPGAVNLDVAVDQGGCIATTHETTHDDPVYGTHGVIHYAVDHSVLVVEFGLSKKCPGTAGRPEC